MQPFCIVPGKLKKVPDQGPLKKQSPQSDCAGILPVK
jgi:hypothetical protein